MYKEKRTDISLKKSKRIVVDKDEMKGSDISFE